MAELTREERWRAARDEREASSSRHPFLPDAVMSPDELVVSDGGEDRPLVLVAFPGALDRMAIPISEFFDAVGAPCHRVLVRKLALPFLGHPIGSDVVTATEWLTRLIGGRPALFVGHSLGAFPALLLGTLCAADAVLAVNPTTSLLPEKLEAWQDGRYALLPEVIDMPLEYRDIPTLWASQAAVRTYVHFGYRNEPHRGHAENIAEFESVELAAYYQYQPMYELLRTGKLGPLINGLLSDIALEAISRLCESSLTA